MSALENPNDDVELKNNVIQEKYEDDDFVQGDDLSTAKHSELKSADTFIDTNTGKIIEKDKLTPFDHIRIAAEQSGTVIRNPRSGCKNCFGRGYVGYLDSGLPLICTCIYPPTTKQERDKQAQSLASIMYIKKQNKKTKINLVDKLSQHLSKEYNKRVDSTISEDTK